MTQLSNFIAEVEKVFGKVTVKTIPIQEKGEVEIYMNKQGDVLIPADDIAQTELEKIADGECKIELTRPRNLKFHRKFFKLLTVAYENWEQPKAYHKGELIQASFDQFRSDITILCGYYYFDTNIKGEVRAKAKSIAFSKMEEVEFSELYSKALDVIIARVLPFWSKEQLDLLVSNFG